MAPNFTIIYPNIHESNYLMRYNIQLHLCLLKTFDNLITVFNILLGNINILIHTNLHTTVAISLKRFLL